jgi:copper chaperone
MYEFKVEGMTCGGCVKSVTRAIQQVDPGCEVAVDLKEKSVKVKSVSSELEIKKTIEEAGYFVS